MSRMYCAMEFVDTHVKLQFGKYANGRLAIQLVDDKTGEPMAIATVNVPEIELDEDEILVKDYSENEGMLSFLLAHGLVTTRGSLSYPMFDTYLCRPTDKLKGIMKESMAV